MGNQHKSLTLALLPFLLLSPSLMFFVLHLLVLIYYLLVPLPFLNLIALFFFPLIVLSRTFYLGKRLGWAKQLMVYTCCSVTVFNILLLPHLLITWSITSSMQSYLLSLQLVPPIHLLNLHIFGMQD